ncbi:hypothetical protein B9G98_01171 [Wickerhamiella sorbophila]|uniref:Uncharacterized protein n=1 Tax=Wickerhamiella sorbophila TaxID=45607 RepID=A0A2T0FEY1_9ASCO|nr:hypothetical protein B9G98_01171 [Wickerhamiella sorbophila]PRT53551.1 hypothetical protein B9G98_01171 [Wickerhamiella sorbophila]
MAVLELIVYWVGLGLGFLYTLARSIVEALSSGDTAGLTRILVSLSVVYLVLLIVHRTVRMLWSSFVVLFKLAVLALLLSTGVYVYTNGATETMNAAQELARDLYAQVGSASSTLQSSYQAHGYAKHLFQQAKAAF